MKFKVIVIMALFSAMLFPQKTSSGNVTGGVGLNFIDGNAFYSFRLAPDFSIGKFGVGLDLRLDFDSTGSIRKENFNDASDFLSIIKYIRYGQKKDPVYVSAGVLDNYSLGHGTIVNQYNNSPSIDKRSLGLALDLDFEKFGVESMYSDFSQGGVLGLRGYVRPLQFTTFSKIPVLGKLEVGASFASDFNKYAGVLSGYIDPVTNEFVSLNDRKSTQIYGIDLGLPVVRTSILNIDLYADYSKVMDFGDGASTGAVFSFSGMGLISAAVRLERRWMNDQYMPAYFNSLYEIERFKVIGGSVVSKIKQLSAVTSTDRGIYGSLGITAANMVAVTGSYQRTDFDPKSGQLHLRAEVTTDQLPFTFRAGYDKVNIENEGAMFSLDDRSYMYSEVGYKPYPYLLVSMVYHWTFEPVRDGSDNVLSYKSQKRIEPRVSFLMPINF
ncbi:MAG: hypothetical protein AMXMBFR48_17270 [Ignavibacteriales bacterium]